MKKILPVILALLILSLIFHDKIFSQAPKPPQQEDVWVFDAEVTSVGKGAVRARDFVDLTLRNYNWACLKKTGEVCDNSNNPLVSFWAIIRNIAYALLALFVLGAAFVMIITRGQNVGIMRFVPRFLFVFVLITLSFSLVQFIYQIADIIQGFFLRFRGDLISTRNLLYVGFNYTFDGYRLLGDKYNESVSTSLLLTRLTSLTYYVMTYVLLIRKIILWFFVIISPIFPLLIFWGPIRNTAKIWIGEFFRWLLYAPLFAIFLHGLVFLWAADPPGIGTGTGIPLPFDFSKVGEVVYPTAINILLGGPGQKVSFSSPTVSNSVNLPDTFALYVVALIMLWIVILLPWLLLRIFLDYLSTVSLAENSFIKQAIATINRRGGTPQPPREPQPPGFIQPTGIARALPFLRGKAAVVIPTGEVEKLAEATARLNAEILRLTNLSIPKMRDIAQYERAFLSADVRQHTQVNQYKEVLTKIGSPVMHALPHEREQFNTIRTRLVGQQGRGNPLATSIISASLVASRIPVGRELGTREVLRSITNPATIQSIVEKERYTGFRNSLIQERERGNPLATQVLSAASSITSKELSEESQVSIAKPIRAKLLEERGRGNPIAGTLLSEVEKKEAQIATSTTPAQVRLPQVNRVQQVSLEDYEEVKKMWQENYREVEPPHDISGKQVSRLEWIKADVEKINQAISLLASVDTIRIQQGMEMVANILPFLLLGGFSNTEVITYLKAKLEAAKAVLGELGRKAEEEETMVSVEKKKEEKPKEAMSAEVEKEIPPKESDKLQTELPHSQTEKERSS